MEFTRFSAAPALLCITLAPSSASQQTTTRDTAMARAAATDRAYLRTAQSPGSARESQWKRADWRDPSPHSVTLIDANGQRLEALDWGGRGEALVFLPGMGHTAHIFDEFAPRFVDHHHVVALTLRGHGASSQPAHAYTVDSLAADVSDALVALGLRDVTLVGHSLGGHVANRVAATHPSLVRRVIYLDAAKDSTGLAALRAAAPSVRPAPASDSSGRAHSAQRRAFFNYWSDALEADYRAARTAPEVPAMSDLYSLQNWHNVRQPQLDICALDTPAVQFPWLSGAGRAKLDDKIQQYVAQQFIPWERASCERFKREAPRGTLIVVPESNHYVFLVSPEQTYVAMRRWLERVAKYPQP